MTVLWGARAGDVQYGSRDFWRRNLRVGMPTMTVDRPVILDVGVLLEGSWERDTVFRVDSLEGREVAFEEIPYEALMAERFGLQNIVASTRTLA